MPFKRRPSDQPSASTSLWQRFLSLRQMDSAWERVRQNGGCAGGDGVTIPAFQPGSGRRVAEIADSLRRGVYRPGAYRFIDIPKTKGGHRRLAVPSIADRIVHTGLAQILSPVLDPQFEESSFAYRPGRSVQQAVEAIARWRDAGFWHVIEADIVGFFDAVRHDQLLVKLEVALAGHVGGVEIVELVGHILEHQAQETGVQGKGIAQGSPLSPLLANLYLDALDEVLDGRGVRLVRFADDFVILCKRRVDAEKALQDAEAALAEHALELHPGGTRIIDFERGFEFLGHMFVRSFALQQVSDQRENPVSVMQDLAREDDTLIETIETESAAGYDRGDRVLYLHDRDRRLELRNQSFAVMTNKGRELAVIAHGRVDRIEVGPLVEVAPAVLDHCLATDTDFAFVDGYGGLRGALNGPGEDRGGLQLRQAAVALDSMKAAQLARSLVEARLRNQRTQLFRLNRKPARAEVVTALAHMQAHLRKLPLASDVAAIRGHEGAVGALYWPALALLTKEAPSKFRRSRPGKDPLNATVNYLSSLLLRDMKAALQHAGLHTGFGVLHVSRDRAEGAVYDLMEPFRAPLTEGLAATLFNARRLRPEMFTLFPDGKGIRISSDARRAIITGYEQALARRVNVTGRTIKLAWRPLMRRQAQDLAVALRKDDLSLFQPYLMEA